MTDGKSATQIPDYLALSDSSTERAQAILGEFFFAKRLQPKAEKTGVGFSREGLRARRAAHCSPEGLPARELYLVRVRGQGQG